MTTVNVHSCDKCQKVIAFPRGGLRLKLTEAEWVGGLNGDYVGPLPTYGALQPPPTPKGAPFRDTSPMDAANLVLIGPVEVTLCRDCLAVALGFEKDKDARENRDAAKRYSDSLYR